MARARRRAGAAPSWSSRPTLTRTPTPPAAAEEPSGKQALGSKLAGLGTGILARCNTPPPPSSARGLNRRRRRRRGKKKVGGGEGKGDFDWAPGFFAFRSAGWRVLPCLCYSATSSAFSLPAPRSRHYFSAQQRGGGKVESSGGFKF
jgi:hypothetical protein